MQTLERRDIIEQSLILETYRHLIGEERKLLSQASEAGDEVTVSMMTDYLEEPEGMFTGILILAVIILSVNMVLCLVRAVLGPRFSDRLIAINMIGTKTCLLYTSRCV